MWAGHITSLLNCWGPAAHTPGARRWHRWAGQSVSIHIDDQHWQKNSSWDSTVHIFDQIISQFRSSPVRVSTNWAPVGFLDSSRRKIMSWCPLYRLRTCDPAGTPKKNPLMYCPEFTQCGMDPNWWIQSNQAMCGAFLDISWHCSTLQVISPFVNCYHMSQAVFCSNFGYPKMFGFCFDQQNLGISWVQIVLSQNQLRSHGFRFGSRRRTSAAEGRQGIEKCGTP